MDAEVRDASFVNPEQRGGYLCSYRGFEYE
jgi:hypothetical protein